MRIESFKKIDILDKMTVILNKLWMLKMSVFLVLLLKLYLFKLELFCLSLTASYIYRNVPFYKS